jgi:O-antigen/teichoic acid export membrane protein
MTIESSFTPLVSGRTLARNMVFNLLGQGIPLLAALFAIPFLVESLGTDRFGILSLAWIVIGYFSLFDLGLGRALTKLVAERAGKGAVGEIHSLVWTALFMMVLLGTGGAIVLALLSPWLVREALKIPQMLQNETLDAFYLLALSVPFVISSAGLRGVLEAMQRFDLVNTVRIPLGFFTFCGPLLALPFSRSLTAVVAILVGVRVIATMAHLWQCFRVIPALRKKTNIQRSATSSLLHFGSWMTVSNIVGPLMVYLDRFLIGALVSVAAVAYYATPYEVVTKLWIIPGALTGVLFPAFSASVNHNPGRAAKLYGLGTKYIFLTVYPFTLIFVTLAHEGLELWLGKEFAQHGSMVLQGLTLGVLINSLAQVPFALIQGAGRPDLTAKLHLFELPFYLIGVYWMILQHGIEGAVIAWVTRALIDAGLLFWIGSKFVPGMVSANRSSILTIIVCIVGLGFGLIPSGFGMKMLTLSVTMLAFILAAWFMVLAPQERLLLRSPSKLLGGTQ